MTGVTCPHMVTDAEKMEAVLSDPTFNYRQEDRNIQDILPILEQIVQQGKLLIVRKMLRVNH